MNKYAQELQRKCGEIDHSKPMQALESTAEAVLESIHQFFSKSGEQENVGKMYEAVYEPKIEMVNFDKMESIYQEYLEGMSTFVNEVCSQVAISESVEEAYKAQTKTAAIKDHEFIDSISENAQINPRKSYEYEEGVADLFASMVSFTETVADQLDHAKTIYAEGYDDSVKAESVKLMCDSIRYYWEKTLETMFESYDELCETVGKTPNANSEFVLV